MTTKNMLVFGSGGKRPQYRPVGKHHLQKPRVEMGLLATERASGRFTKGSIVEGKWRTHAQLWTFNMLFVGSGVHRRGHKRLLVGSSLDGGESRAFLLDGNKALAQ